MQIISIRYISRWFRFVLIFQRRKKHCFDSFVDPAQFLATRLNFSTATNSSDLQKFLESNITHRQGFTYGAPLGKKLCLFIDDLHASTMNQFEKFKNAPEVNRLKKRAMKFRLLFGNSFFELSSIIAYFLLNKNHMKRNILRISLFLQRQQHR